MTDEFRSRFPVGTTMSFAQYMDIALYDESIGFYATSGEAGRRGDFLTSPEVGPLFGALIARRLDQQWRALGSPDTFVVAEFGAGPGTLARSIAFAAPECSRALRYVMIDRSARQRAGHGSHLEPWLGDLSGPELETFVRGGRSGPRYASSPEAPWGFTGVILANELLDNLAFDIVRHDGSGGVERLDVTHDVDGLDFVATPIELPPTLLTVVTGAEAGRWLPLQVQAGEWLSSSIARLDRGLVVVIDFGAPTAEIASRPDMGWLRTFAGQRRGGHPLDSPGRLDITADVAIDQLATVAQPTSVTTQRRYLGDLGIAGLVDEGRRVWHERAAAPDVDALRARSRIGEADALLETGGLGDFLVLEWTV